MRQRSRRRRQGNANTLDAIPALTCGELLARWEASYGALPHKMISTRLLVLAARYRDMKLRLIAIRDWQSAPPGYSCAWRKRPMSRAQRVPPTPRSGAQRPGAILCARPRHGMHYVGDWDVKCHLVEGGGRCSLLRTRLCRNYREFARECPSHCDTYGNSALTSSNLDPEFPTNRSRELHNEVQWLSRCSAAISSLLSRVPSDQIDGRFRNTQIRKVQ